MRGKFILLNTALKDRSQALVEEGVMRKKMRRNWLKVVIFPSGEGNCQAIA